jgi:hypothetical protein
VAVLTEPNGSELAALDRTQHGDRVATGNSSGGARGQPPLVDNRRKGTAHYLLILQRALDSMHVPSYARIVPDPLLPRFYRFREQAEAERKIAKAILEAGDAPGNDSMPLRRSADGHDPARLRGLPAIGRNVSGARVDTDPVKALLAKEARGERGR